MPVYNQLGLSPEEQKFLIALLEHQREFYEHYTKDKYEKVKENHRLCNGLLYKLTEK